MFRVFITILFALFVVGTGCLDSIEPQDFHEMVVIGAFLWLMAMVMV